MIHRLLVCAFLAFVGTASNCAAPQPVPTPPAVQDAAPLPPFVNLIVNCGEIRAQVVAARPAVNVCLATQLPADGCMVDLLSTWGPGPLACAVRSEGMAAFAKLPTDTGTAVDQAIAKASRLWITSHNVGFKD